ncbi:hypothetical protein MNBD_GAMMA21-1037 [hydrothermal vent metagenome]|uniref:Uncharacterized protein n=1 Tax=hydrothermal vent metagenome TaxID=652676 RepID=A0A3B1A9I7_9ZZZZ
METEAELVWAVLFGAIGLGYFIYGKRQRAIMPFFSGFGLFIFPYFMPNVYVLILTGVLLMALPYFIDI